MKDVFNIGMAGFRASPPGIGQTQGTKAPDYEALTTELPWLAPGNNSFTFQTAFTASKRWRACDVYLEIITVPGATIAVPINAIFSVLVFEISQSGTKTLIASGRWGRFSLGAPDVTPQGPIWIVASRSGAERYEVAFLYDSTAGGGVSGETVKITTVCTDEMTEPPPMIGAILGSAVVGVGPIIVGAPADRAPFPELLGVQAVCGVAGARYLHFTDVDGAGAFVPHLVWGVGELAGDGVVDMNVRYRCKRNGFRLTLSSTPVVTTPAADGAIQCLWR